MLCLTRHQCPEWHSHARMSACILLRLLLQEGHWKAALRRAMGNAGHHICGRTPTPSGRSAFQRPTPTQRLKGGGQAIGPKPRAHPSTPMKLQQTLRSSPSAAAHASVLATSLLCWKRLLFWQCYSGNADGMQREFPVFDTFFRGLPAVILLWSCWRSAGYADCHKVT